MENLLIEQKNSFNFLLKKMSKKTINKNNKNICNRYQHFLRTKIQLEGNADERQQYKEVTQYKTNSKSYNLSYKGRANHRKEKSNPSFLCEQGRQSLIPYYK